MSNNFTLDDIRAAADAKYGSTTIRFGEYSVELVNAIRLPKEKRDALLAKQSELEADSADQLAIMGECIKLVAKVPAMAAALVEEIGDDLAVMAEVFTAYTEGTQAGEASASAN